MLVSIPATKPRVQLRVPIGFKPRVWAREAYALYLQHDCKEFSVNACPGAGKTKFAVMLAYNELHRGQIDRIDIVGPSTHICDQWMRDMASWGVHLDPENNQESRDCVGRVMTYQRLGMDPEAFRPRDRRRTLVILDEIHHAGDSKTWGDALRMVFGPAHRRLLLSGTPFRSDNNPIPFVRYTQGVHGTSISDYTYGYGEALRDNYCAPLYFPHHDGEFEWERDGKNYTASFDTAVTGMESSDRLRTALDPSGAYAQGLLREAHEQLMELRKTHPDAAGIVFGRDVENVGRIADVLEKISGRRPTSVTNDDPDASEKIRSFRSGRDPWLVSVRMVSEGVDIPRLRVGVYLTNIRTELFFRQAAGRLVRMVEGVEDQSGYLYIPSEPRLLSYAVEMQSERKHFLKVPKINMNPFSEELMGPREREPNEDEPDYRFLNSTGERAGMIDTGPPVGSGGQHLFDFAVDMLPEELPKKIEPVAPPPPPPQELLLHEKKEQIRRRGGQMSSLVRQVSIRYGVEYRQIHAQLNKKQGVKSQAQCTMTQLVERENLLDKWLRVGSF
jgi:superfamily II DNA or RNA helicase